MKAIALLSGGLDSVVSMLLASKEVKVELAITIDYGQRARENEIKAARNICRIYNVKHEVVELPFMHKIQSDLIKKESLPITNPWVPNRNGLFINLAACYAESMKAGLVICGFNREEAFNFPDNSEEYVRALNNALYYSTTNHVKVKSFVQDMDKIDIIRTAAELGLDFRYIWSCYGGGEKPCLRCSSCLRNMEAFAKAGIKYNEDFIC
ncbi:7-cyano-7-deazaguanine synthase [Thermosyntropha lipolytica DSM 11003]|uniref:7-cyano-7-deazaguanine synthase n=1 Tax=Thermosyntropha lipolytica DSM 11003 TaxID=1123382 RepID=A0A1M5PD96_9FIRM|nr:7-cyano-7-deazaguanine synthase QueC [Thermosyntropha lipolytica]SHG99764.1 7-cyano-7-deazaguanine synthase [Thermosyntropha lipolytica DSM 11003]